MQIRTNPKKRLTGRDLAGSHTQSFYVLSPWHQDVTPSGLIDVFANQEAHLSLVFRVFIGVSLCRYD